MIYALTHGEYSDFNIIGIYEGPENIDLEKVIEEYGKEKIDSLEFHEFVKEKCGLIEVTYKELWCGEMWLGMSKPEFR